VHNQLLAV